MLNLWEFNLWGIMRVPFFYVGRCYVYLQYWYIAYCTDITISADTSHAIITTQGARVGLLSLRLDTDRTIIQLQSVSSLLVWTAFCHQRTLRLDRQQHTTEKLVSLRQRHWEVGISYVDCIAVVLNLNQWLNAAFTLSKSKNSITSVVLGDFELNTEK